MVAAVPVWKIKEKVQQFASKPRGDKAEDFDWTVCALSHMGPLRLTTQWDKVDLFSLPGGWIFPKCPAPYAVSNEQPGAREWKRRIQAILSRLI
jgi:hypothetical protein